MKTQTPSTNASIDSDTEARNFLATNVKGLLADLEELMEARNADLRQATRYHDATPAEAKLFATLRGGERSIAQLARSIGVSRQAVHRTAHRLAEQGVVQVASSREDGREKVVRISARGRRVQRMAARNLMQVESELARTMGQPKLEQLRQLLTEAIAALVAETEAE